MRGENQALRDENEMLRSENDQCRTKNETLLNENSKIVWENSQIRPKIIQMRSYVAVLHNLLRKKVKFTASIHDYRFKSEFHEWVSEIETVAYALKFFLSEIVGFGKNSKLTDGDGRADKEV